jgi:hypothetical protein
VNLKNLIVTLSLFLLAACSSAPASSPNAPSQATTTAKAAAADPRTTPTSLAIPGNNGAKLIVDCKLTSGDKVTFTVTGENLGTGSYTLGVDNRGGAGEIGQDGQIEPGEIVLSGVGITEKVTFAVSAANMNRTLRFTGGCQTKD